MIDFKQLINNIKKDARDRQQEQNQEIIKRLYENIINIYDQKANEIDGNHEQILVEFKVLVLEYHLILYKDKKDQMKKIYRLVNKFLKNETKEIGSKIYKYLYSTINVHQYDKIGESNIRAFNEFLIFINENSPRIENMWNNNLSYNKSEKMVSK